MELFGELFLTATLALFLSFLVAKLVAVAMAAGDSDSKPAAVSDEALRFQGSEAERKVDFVEEVVEKVDHFSEEIAEKGIGDPSEISDDLPVEDLVEKSSSGIAEESATNDVDSVEPDEVRVWGGQPEAQDEATAVESEISIGDEDDDWEGIERDELGSDFEAAVKFVESRADGGFDIPASFVGGDVQMELYGLRKVATEGACHEPLSQALDLSGRAKCDGEHWLRIARHAWQRLGDMTREKAMEQYITILSENVPGWIQDTFEEENKQECSEGKKAHSAAAAFSPNERKPEVKPGAEKVDFVEASDLENKASG